MWKGVYKLLKLENTFEISVRLSENYYKYTGANRVSIKPIPIQQIPNKLFARLPIEKVYKNGRVRMVTPPIRSDSKQINRINLKQRPKPKA